MGKEQREHNLEVKLVSPPEKDETVTPSTLTPQSGW
jgi:hypothetical protein